MPKSVFGRDFQFMPASQLLTFEEIARLTRIFAGRGVEKIRLTGGEPLLRRGIEKLVAMLAEIPSIRDLTLTTNASLLAGKASALRAAGLHRITVSLDSLDDVTFRAMNDVEFPVVRVLDGIDAAVAAGFSPIKINMVVKRGVNDRDVLPMARRFRGPDYILRFIEFMDVGSTNGWRLEDVVSAAEIVRTISTELPLAALESNYHGEVAGRFRYRDGGGEIGVIASVTQPFCHDCTRARLASEGLLYTCLFATRGHDCRALLRGGASDEEIAAFTDSLWSTRSDRYSEERGRNTETSPKVEMSHIGG
jgi:cyclic pyranopterin phosphate synthase